MPETICLTKYTLETDLLVGLFCFRSMCAAIHSIFKITNKSHKKKEETNMSYLELTVDNVAAHFWQSGRYFFRQYETETKAKRISAQEYMSAYETYHGI